MRFGALILIMSSTTTIAMGCSSASTGEREEVANKSEALIAPGMLQDGYSPLVPDTLETVAQFNPMLGHSPENVAFLDGYAYVTSLLSGELLRVNLDTHEVSSIPFPVPQGTFMAGIKPDGDSLVVATAVFGQYGPVEGSVFKLDTVSQSVTELTTIPGAALNGLAIFGDRWFSVDAMDMSGVIWTGSTAGGEATVWYQGPAVAPDGSYVWTPCNPPMAVGGNGIQLYKELGLSSFVVSDTTGRTVSKIPILADGTAGTEQIWYDSVYPDDIWPDHCGWPGSARGVFVATHGLHRVLYVNPFGGEATELTTGLDCDGPTAAVVHDGYLYVTCGGDPLICRPDANGNPDPNLQAVGSPALKRIKLKLGYQLFCRP